MVENSWIKFVKEIQKKKNISYKDALKEASNLRKGEHSHSHNKGKRKKSK